LTTNSRPIWIDLDNTPHVPFFQPIISRLRARGHELIISARDAYNVSALLRLHQIPCTTIGRHLGKHKVMKVLGTGSRALELAAWAARRRPCIAVSHGSRAQTFAARLLNVPSIVIADYEHVTHLWRPDHTIVPEIMTREVASRLSQDVMTYPGIKEDVYAANFVPDPGFAEPIGLSRDKIIVTVRPPATEAHYHRAESDVLFAATMQMLALHPAVLIVMLPRSSSQRAQIQHLYGSMITSNQLLIPAEAVSGLDLVWQSDLVISGGGTMNREAAALGVPVYSIFRGQIGAVDRHLAEHGRLRLIESVSDVKRIALVKRSRPEHIKARPTEALDRIVEHISALVSGDAAHVAMAAQPRS
jgi:uncharacterized protein